MAGTFYRAPSPGSDSFVEVGDTVEVGQVVCIIESMKMMHEIKSTEHGTLVSFEVADGQPINTEDELIRLS
jgi:acetyl-CoA carboxylase biotin carboxyl carrier protein